MFSFFNSSLIISVFIFFLTFKQPLRPFTISR